jgi:hypothetical protein
VARTADLVTAVNEIATNSLVHGGGKGTIRVWRDVTTLICKVRDAGRYDRPLADRERPQARLSEPRGLWVANQFCDLLQIRTFPDGTVVRAHTRRNPVINCTSFRTPSQPPTRGLEVTETYLPATGEVAGEAPGGEWQPPAAAP